MSEAGADRSANLQKALKKIELQDTITIELNVAHEGTQNYRSLNRLSTGQQCTAILHMLLLENLDPLLMNQPEDNLDSAFIADRIVTQLRSELLEIIANIESSGVEFKRDDIRPELIVV
jgi:ABC-type enterochelin transport system ATPase subunit